MYDTYVTHAEIHSCYRTQHDMRSHSVTQQQYNWHYQTMPTTVVGYSCNTGLLIIRVNSMVHCDGLPLQVINWIYNQIGCEI